MPPYFIDFEAFQHGDGDFEVKELCMVAVGKPFGKHLYLLFGPSGEWHNLEQALIIINRNTFTDSVGMRA